MVHCQAESFVPFVLSTAQSPRVDRSPPLSLLCRSPPDHRHLALCPVPPSSCCVVSSVAPFLVLCSLPPSSCLIVLSLLPLPPCFLVVVHSCHRETPLSITTVKCRRSMLPPPSRHCCDLIVASAPFLFFPPPHCCLIVVHCCRH